MVRSMLEYIFGSLLYIKWNFVKGDVRNELENRLFDEIEVRENSIRV